MGNVPLIGCGQIPAVAVLSQPIARVEHRKLPLRALSLQSTKIVPSNLQNQQFLRRGIPDRRERYAGIESNQPALMPDRESKQINVRQLPRPMNPGRVHDIRIQQTDFIRPEFVDVLAAGLSQMRDDSLRRQRIGIAGIRHDANTPILRDRARCPAFPRMLREPVQR
jgi:hypothetical protein